MKQLTNEQKSIVINIKVEPRSSKSGIAGYYRDGLKVKLTSPPLEGKANKELVEILAREFKISKKDIEIIAGRKSKNKIVRLNGVRSTLSFLRKQESREDKKLDSASSAE